MILSEGGEDEDSTTTLCQADFETSRMCTSREIMETVPTPSSGPSEGLAWVRPVFVQAFGTTALDASGVAERSIDLSCNGWSSIDRGLVVTAQGGFRTESGAVPLNVACCALVP